MPSLAHGMPSFLARDILQGDHGHEMFSGKFEAEKTTKFIDRNPVPERIGAPWAGIDR